MIPVTPVEVAKANAAKSKSVVEKEKAAAPAPKKEAPKAASDSDSDSSSKKRREKKEKESERDAKKRKTDVVSPALVPQKTVSSSAPLEEQHPHLAQGPFALFRTDDMLRDKMQLMLWTSLGEPPAAALSAGANVDLSAYAVSKMTESPKIVAAAPEASPPPIADAASGETAAAAPVAASPAASPVPSPSPPAPIFRSRVELAYRIEAAMFAKFKDSNSSAYKQKYRDLAPQLRDTNNEELNVSLFLNRLEPTELVSMSVAALAPSSLKAKREKEAAYNREAARCDIGNDSGATDQFLCEKCGLRNCTYFMVRRSMRTSAHAHAGSIRCATRSPLLLIFPSPPLLSDANSRR